MYQMDQPQNRQSIPMLARAIIIILVVAIVVLIVLIGLQQPESSTQATNFEFSIATQEIRTGEDIVVGINNATIYVPRDAINIAGTISITPRPPNLFSIAEKSEWSRSLVVNVEFRNGDGKPVPQLTFAKPAEICFKITAERWEDYTQHPDEYEVQTYLEDQNPPRWEPLPMRTYPERNELCGEVNHLSLFALATRLPPGIPVTGVDPTPTSKPPSVLDFLKDLLGNEPDNNPTDNQSGEIYEP